MFLADDETQSIVMIGEIAAMEAAGIVISVSPARLGKPMSDVLKS